MRVAILAFLLTFVHGAPSPDAPSSAGGGYGAPSEPACTLQRSEQKTSYSCQEDQECSTSYEEECSTSYEQQCDTKYEQKCETSYENKCPTSYEEQCKTEY